MLLLLVILSFVLLCALGYTRLWNYRNALNTKRTFAIDYRDKFANFLNSGEADSQDYEFLVYHSNKMQANMGPIGRMYRYHDPFVATYSNYPIILNMIPDLNRNLRESLYSEDDNFRAATIRDSIIRYLASLDDSIEGINSILYNPFVWLREGFQRLLAFPYDFLNFAGLISNERLENALHSKRLQVLGSLMTIISVIGAVMGIIADWNETTAWISRLLGPA